MRTEGWRKCVVQIRNHEDRRLQRPGRRRPAQKIKGVARGARDPAHPRGQAGTAPRERYPTVRTPRFTGPPSRHDRDPEVVFFPGPADHIMGLGIGRESDKSAHNTRLIAAHRTPPIPCHSDARSPSQLRDLNQNPMLVPSNVGTELVPPMRAIRSPILPSVDLWSSNAQPPDLWSSSAPTPGIIHPTRPTHQIGLVATHRNPPAPCHTNNRCNVKARKIKGVARGASRRPGCFCSLGSAKFIYPIRVRQVRPQHKTHRCP